MTKCQLCGQHKVYIHFNKESICLDCYNGKMFKELGVRAESYPEGVTIRDSRGEAHQFHLRKQLDPISIMMEAEELAPGGYRFAVHGDLDGDQGELLLQLIAKAERGMAEQYAEQGQLPDGQSYHSIKNHRLAGRIEYNSMEEDVPLLVVDGKPYTWEEIGKMMMTYEGFQVKLELLDPSEEVE